MSPDDYEFIKAIVQLLVVVALVLILLSPLSN